MDEIVFTREALRRELLKLVDMLDRARDEYDPEPDLPPADVNAARAAITLHVYAGEYMRALTDRLEARDSIRGDGR